MSTGLWTCERRGGDADAAEVFVTTLVANKRFLAREHKLFAGGAGGGGANVIAVDAHVTGGDADFCVGAEASAGQLAGGKALTGLADLGCRAVCGGVAGWAGALAALAAVLLMVGYKLAKPSVFVHLWNNGYSQFIPFVITVIAVVRIDLLKGVAIGLVVSIIFILYQNMKIAYSFKKEKFHDDDVITIKLAQEVSFLNKAAIKSTLGNIPEGSKLIIDASNTNYIDFDVVELIKDFRNVQAEDKEIDLTLKGFKENYSLENSHFKHVKIKEDK